ncbi:MAG: tetratricopeptide repeat protein [Bacteroidota bacterium]
MGLLYLKTHQKALAQVALQKASRADFSMSIQEEATLQYAKVSYDLGHFSNTIAALQAFKRNHPQSRHRAEVDILLSEAYLRTRDYDLAINHIERHAYDIANTAQIYQQVTFFRGGEYFNNGQYKQATPYFKKSLQHTPNKAMAIKSQLWLGESYSAQQSYDAAIAAYRQVLQHSTPQTAHYQQALYGAAYAHFNTGDYSQARTYFEQYAKTEKQPSWLRDAQVRIADCCYVAKDYEQALSIYKQLRKYYPAHVTYQEGIIQSLQGKLPQAAKSFQTILEMHAHTPYYEKALFEKAHLIFTQGDYTQAIKTYTTFIEQEPHSQLLPDALLQRAIAHVNLKEYDPAVENYARLLKDYPTHPNAQSALLELPKILRIQGKGTAFAQYLSAYKAANPNTPGLEQLAFDAAKALFYEPNYLPAIEQLSSFLETYPKSRLAVEARFLTAEAYYRLEDTLQAQAHYQQALQDRSSPFHSKVLLRLATLCYQQQSFTKALRYYRSLRKAAKNKKEVYYALEGIMKASHALQQYEAVDQAVARILAQGNLAVNATNEALLFLSKSAIQRKDAAKAIKHLTQLVQNGQDKYAAEGQYLLAMLRYEAGEYEHALEDLFRLNQRFPSYQEWTNKGFLLIADSYIALEDNFQATATLQSIIEHAKDSSIVASAKEKLAKLAEKAAIADKIKLANKEKPLPEDDKEYRTINE